MRKLSTLLLGFLFATFTFGKSVTMEQASEVASKYLLATSLKSTRTVASSFSKLYNGVTTYYVFNYLGGGFIVVSADDAATPILGYSDEGYIETEISSPEARFWLESYSMEIAKIVASKADNTESRVAWDNILNNRIKAPSANVSPLLTTTWDQIQYYNFYCPLASGGPGGKAYTGCVATTMGQIMKYHNFPATGVGSHSYNHSTFGQLTANFGATSYNFANMLDKASVTKYKDIARLLFHAGVSVNMGYAADGSGAFSENVPYALSNYFNYDNKTIKLADMSDYSATEWQTLLMSELNASRPLYYSGNDPTVGHAWVCDGYQTSGGSTMFHMNWGWSGFANGYFAIGALNSGNGDFNIGNAVIYGIKPGNPDLIVRFTDLEQNNSISLGSTFDINCSVVKGIPTAVNLYIDKKLVFNTTQTAFTYTWNTANYDLSTIHMLRVEAIDATDTVYHEVNVGLSEWISQASGFAATSRGISYIHAVDSMVAWATAYDGSGGDAAINEFTKTTDGGITWVPGQVLGGSVYGLGNICGLNANIAYVSLYNKSAAQDNTCGVYKTSNGGSTWAHLTGALQGAASFADNVWFWDENNGMCHGDVTGAGTSAYFEIYTTTNGGATWNRVPKANINGGTPAESGEGGYTSVIQAVGANTIMFGTNKGNLYISHDRGFNWTISNSGITPITDGISHISFKDENNGLVAQISTTVILRETQNGGLSWQTINPVGPFLTSGLAYVPGTEKTYVSTGSQSGATGASYSFDGGNNWTQFLWTESDQFLAVDFVNNHCGWAGAFNANSVSNGMYKYTGLLDPSAVRNPVTNLEALPTGQSVQLTWAEPTTIPLSYNIYRNDTLVANTTTLQYNDTPVAGGSQSYCVAAVYPNGESPKTCSIAFITLNIPNTDQAAYRIYPNPSSKIINVVTPVRFNEIRVINNLGKVVYRNTTKGTNMHISTEGFDSGMYILQIYTGTQVISKKISIIR